MSDFKYMDIIESLAIYLHDNPHIDTFYFIYIPLTIRILIIFKQYHSFKFIKYLFFSHNQIGLNSIEQSHKIIDLVLIIK